MTNFQYQIGGSLQRNALSYVMRQADEDFYQALKAGEFCYVLNSRQTGKSSLRVQTMQRLQADGVVCGVVDITSIGSHDITSAQWYLSFIRRLARSLGLRKSKEVEIWWNQRLGSPVDRLQEFIEEILLTETQQPIAIFIDEIDSILRLDFKDDFFAFIRACFNQRTENKAYQRLTFALLGVATPPNLIQDKNRTPFNLGTAIDLQGFRLEEVQPLIAGLQGKVDNPQLVMEQILDWTEGQPFLTQKLCQLISHSSISPSPSPQSMVERIVRSHIINNWETQDEPEHLRTIRDRLLCNEQRAGRLLGIYQQILTSESSPKEIPADGSSQQTELRLSGLVVQRDGKLRVYNRIYAAVFNKRWVGKALANLRPYDVAIRVWLKSGKQDTSRLLQGEALKEALAWKAGKSLSEEDDAFLTASQEQALVTEKKRNQILAEAQKQATEQMQQAKRRTRFAFYFLAMALSLAAFTGVMALSAINTAQEAQTQLEKALKEQEEAWKKQEVAQIRLRALNTKTTIAGEKVFTGLLKALPIGHQVQKALAKKDSKKEIFGIAELEIKAVLSEAISLVQQRNTLKGHEGSVYGVSFSRDGKRIASASEDNTIKIWNIETGALERTLTGHKGWVIDVSFSPNEKQFASASADKTIKIWNIETGALERTLTGHKGEIKSLDYSRDGKRIASASTDNTIKIWNSQTGTLERTLEGHEGLVHDIDYSRDGKRIASASTDNTIKIWNSQTGALERTLEGHEGSVIDVSFSRDGKQIVSASADKTIKIWKSRNNQTETSEQTLKGHKDSVYDVSFSRDGKQIVSASKDKTIKIWNIETGTLERTLKGHEGEVNSLDYSRDGKLIASASDDQTIKIWHSQPEAFEQTLIGHKSDKKDVNSLDYSRDGKLIASASDDQTVKIWNLETGELEQTLTEHEGSVYGVSFSQDGKLIASASEDETIKIWNSQTGALERTLEGHKGWVIDVSFSQDGKQIASASADKTIKIWHSQTGALERTLTGHKGEVKSLDYSRDGKRIASASTDKTIKIWHSQTGTLEQTLTGHEDEINSVSFSPNGKRIASASDDHKIKIWNTETGTEVYTFSGHQGIVTSVSFSPDSKQLASASSDSTIKIWNTETGTEVYTFSGHQDSVWSVNYSPDGNYIASVGMDGTVKIWNWNLDDLMARGCRWIEDYLRTHPEEEELIDICPQSIEANGLAPKLSTIIPTKNTPTQRSMEYLLATKHSIGKFFPCLACQQKRIILAFTFNVNE